MIFDPKTNKYPYPKYTDEHYLVVKKDNGIIFDENYPYIDKSKSYLFKRFWVRVLLRTIVFPLTKIRLGLKVEGKENLKHYKHIINDGIISVCNHVHMWDYLGILRTIKPRKPYLLAWKKNLNGESATLVKMVGGVPIPENDYKATKAFMNQIDNMLSVDKGWLHIYPEGSMWEYYAPIRPFKTGAAHMAIKFNKPILPFAYSYRKPGWIRRKLFHQIALFTLRVGDPIYKDESLSGIEQEEDLTRRIH